MSNRLKDQHALLTGAAGGIGAAVARAFLAQGARCTIIDIGSTASKQVIDLQSQFSGAVQYLGADITQTALLDSVLDASQSKFGVPHILFNNAAVFDMAPLLESNEASFDRLFGINVKGLFFVMQKVLKRMVDAKVQGSVINMASQAGRRGEALVSHYCATKAAVISYTQSAALAMAPHKIRVNAISPGVIDTPMWQHVDALFAKYEHLPIGEKKRLVGLAVPLGYMGSPDDITGAALFLATKESSYVTAQTLNVDGGSVMS
jgi:D-sorbitol dehydrogenase (acceptor)